MHVQNRLKSSWVTSVLFRYALWLFQKKYSLRLNQTVVVQVPFCSTSTSILGFALSSLWFLSVFSFPSSAVVLTQPVNDGLPPPLKPRCVVCWTCKPAVVFWVSPETTAAHYTIGGCWWEMVLKPLLLQNSVVKPLSPQTWKIFEIPIRLENNERKIHLVECPPLLPIVIIIIIVIFTYFDRSQQWHFCQSMSSVKRRTA